MTFDPKSTINKDYYVIMADSPESKIYDCMNIPLFHTEQLFGILFIARHTLSPTASIFDESDRRVLQSVGESLSYFTDVVLRRFISYIDAETISFVHHV